jgi:hypothetical protein
MLQQTVTRRGQLNVVALSHEQFRPEYFLELLDTRTDSRLRQEERISRAAEMARSCDFQKGLE